MLENNFNELDNDFITLWSRQFLSNDFTQIENEMEKLAELGQVNAINAYYVIAINADKQTTNAKIDALTDEKAHSRNFNHIFNIARKLCATDPSGKELSALIEIYNREIDEINEIKLKMNQLHLMFDNARYVSLSEDLDKVETRHENTIEKFLCNKVIKKEIEAIKACHQLAKETNNPYVMEKYLELLEGTPIDASEFVERDEKQFKREIVQTHKELVKRYKSNPSPQNAFALGKNMVFFGKKDKSKQMGIEILTKLAERPLSKTLNNYMGNRVDYQEENKPYIDLE